ncbi:Hsp20 family protein [Methanohalobium sp.]|uniref:Hsp20 family protein n=1 Tax=Methanohalobium sp. TaxID=2837493 RepID=UPI0025D7300F|nr:Hsp20 family protein [Methanohalobium sp.]
MMQDKFTTKDLPSLLDEFFPTADMAFRKTPNYPPYNIVKLHGDHSMIEMAVAGFDEDDLSVYQEGNSLNIEGAKNETTEDVRETEGAYLHRGISTRSFKRRFTLANNVEVEDVKLRNGMLNVYLKMVRPEKDKPKSFKINAE